VEPPRRRVSPFLIDLDFLKFGSFPFFLPILALPSKKFAFRVLLFMDFKGSPQDRSPILFGAKSSDLRIASPVFSPFRSIILGGD